jgi:DNA topoisomerase-1
VVAASALRELQPAASATDAKRNISSALKAVAARLGNTPAICRKCYVHPEVLATYLDGELNSLLARAPGKTLQRAFRALPSEAAATLLLLHVRTSRSCAR